MVNIVKGFYFLGLYYFLFLFDMLASVHLTGFAQLCCDIDPEEGASC